MNQYSSSSASLDNKSESKVVERLRPISGIVLMAHSILNWEKPYHAPLVGSAITLIYMLFWLIDASVLSKLCIVAIIAVLLDFSLPIVNGMISAKWIQENEAKFEHICRSLSQVVDRLFNAYRVFAQMKRTSTKSYYSILMCSLLFIAWLGSLVHNLLLAYLFTLVIALYPGISQQEAFKRRILGFASKISSFVGPSKKGAARLEKKPSMSKKTT